MLQTDMPLIRNICRDYGATRVLIDRQPDIRTVTVVVYGVSKILHQGLTMTLEANRPRGWQVRLAVGQD